MVAVAGGLFPQFGADISNDINGTSVSGTIVPLNEASEKPYIVLSGKTYLHTHHQHQYAFVARFVGRLIKPHSIVIS